METLGRDSPAGPSTNSKGLAERFGRSRAVDNKSGRSRREWSPIRPRPKPSMVARFRLNRRLRGSGAKFRLANGAIATRLALPVANPAQRWQGYAVRPICRYVLLVVREEITQTDDREHQPSMNNTKGLSRIRRTILMKRFTARSIALSAFPSPQARRR